VRVCLDIQAAVAQRAGIGRYARALARHLPSAPGVSELALAYFDFRRRALPFPAPGATARPIRWCPGRLARLSWRTLSWPPFNLLAGRADVYHFPNFVLPPLSGGRTVITIHDLSFLRFPEFAEERNRAYLAARIADSVARADAVITDCAGIASEVVATLKLSPDRVFPVPLGVEPEFCPPPAGRTADTLRRLGVDGPYLLTVGTLEPRKNIPFLVDVFERLPSFDGALVIAGMRGWKTGPILARIGSSPLARRIRLLEFVREEDLPSLYAGAAVFVCASFYEGFGLPPLEAMACGVPVVSSTGGSLAEVLGDGAVLLDTFDADRWAAAVSALLSDSALRGRMIELGRRRAATYTWEETARRTARVYQEALA
jgi:glycosyltransferase involved in cell wall biosynthesis